MRERKHPLWVLVGVYFSVIGVSREESLGLPEACSPLRIPVRSFHWGLPQSFQLFIQFQALPLNNRWLNDVEIEETFE